MGVVGVGVEVVRVGVGVEWKWGWRWQGCGEGCTNWTRMSIGSPFWRCSSIDLTRTITGGISSTCGLIVRYVKPASRSSSSSCGSARFGFLSGGFSHAQHSST